ncbi:MAG: DUF4867 family protein [Lachnospiraceae bacterium]|nr:DUF4867 family protein [Lachnospiraceae bacterium]
MLEHLNQANDVKIYSVNDLEFQSYGRIISGYDFSEMISIMENATNIPPEGNVYVASVEELEKCAEVKNIRDALYGGMDIQVGYCNGRNSTYNGFEYHKGSEINVAVTDFMLVLGHSYDISNNSYDISQAKVFFVPKGTGIEMYQTTLHLSPLKVCDEGFKGIVILPKGTNTPLTEDEKASRDRSKDLEGQLLLQRNKWVIAHPDRKPLIDQGAHPGVTGVNKELFY